MKTTILTISSFLIISTLSAQEDAWDVYLAQYEKGPGSTMYNVSIKKLAPDTSLPFLFSAGVKFTNCTNEGLPVSSEFENLSRISDSVIAIVNRSVKNIQVGTFTYQCERRDYFYVSDTTGLRRQINALISKKFSGYTSAFNIKSDRGWDAYLTFLYPNEETLDYLQNQKVLRRLLESGDKLDKARQVDHWLYFKTATDRDCFVQYANKNRFKIETKAKENSFELPFKLHISRTDKVDMSSISNITLELRKEAKKCNGDYDGWETFVIK